MANLDQIRFQKLSIEKFTELDKKDLVKELKKRKQKNPEKCPWCNK